MESKTNRYQSRILREMHHNTENPFNSPPSSTGSHGTVTLTSNLTMGPQGESTRRMDDISINLPSQAALRSAKAPHQPSFNVNTSVLGRAFPEWSRWNPEKDTWEAANDSTPHPREKENITPRGSPNSSVAATPRLEDSDRDKVETTKATSAPKNVASAAGRSILRTRAQMQPQVQTESECSLELSEPSIQPQPTLQEQGGRPRVPTPNGARGSKPRRGNVTALLETLKTAQTKQAESKEESAKQTSPKSQPSIQPQNAAKMQMERRSGLGNLANPATPSHTARSFFLPNLSYMNDFLSGSLRLSSFRNGIPVFVKHGKVHDRESATSPDHHADVEAIAIPEDEEKIFVSLDKIKDEVNALKEHDELVSKQAEQLQEEVEDLHIQIAKYKSRKDSAMGSDSESSIIDHLHTQKSQLEEQVSSLQARLDKANRKISINEIHTESYIAERDEALKSATEHLDKIKHLQSELNLARQQLEALCDDDAQNANTLELENKSLRKDNNSIRQQWKSLLEENQSLRAHNSDVSQKNADLEHDLKAAMVQVDSVGAEFETLQQEYEQLLEEKAVLKQDNLGLERHNDKFFNDNKVLKQQNSLLDRRTHDLQDDVARLQKLLDAAGAETGTMSVDFKDIKYRLQVQNRELAKENAELQQQIIDIEAEFSSKRMALEQEKRRLGAANERLKEQINQISDRFEQIAKESKEEAARYNEQHEALTQQLDLVADQELALADKLKKTADHEAALQSELDRKTDAINEARQITQEIKDFMSAASKKKHTKTARVVDPKGKSTVSETTARSTTSQTDIPIQDDYTQQFDLTQGSDYASIFTQGEMPKLREALRQVRNESPQKEPPQKESPRKETPRKKKKYEPWLVFDDSLEPLSPSIPVPFVAPDLSPMRSVSEMSKEQIDLTKPQPVGILKDTHLSKAALRQALREKTAQMKERSERFWRDNKFGVQGSKSDDTIPRKVSFGQPGVQNDAEQTRPERAAKDSRLASERDLTGRLSVRSEASGMSIPSETSEVDKFHRRNTDSARFDLDTDHEENMTSALFIDDITLQQRKAAEKQNAKNTKPELSKDAKRVLDGLCHDHDCRNCIVCARINSRRHENCGSNTGAGKKTIRVENPTAATSHIPNQAQYEDQSTLRPSQSPIRALHKVLKILTDEETHIKKTLKEKDAEYNRHDPTVHRRVWKQLSNEIDKLRKAQDLKRDQMYYLRDALVAVQLSGEEVTMDYVDMTIHSTMSKDRSWNGVLDFQD
ncbi:hypothetical protein F4677DRAFT_134315 [Hypoxylon crocopeplum]|nr:hypothetical protein F4677DRAFT_134315 [Hypoxylon crocopeplum]